MKIVYVYDAIARIGGVEKILADKMNYFADVCAYDIYLITAAQGNHPFSFPISARVKHIDLNARFHLQYQYKAPLRWWMKWRLDCDFERKIKKQIAQIDPDIIIATTYYKADVVCRLKCRAKKVIESHGARDFIHLTDDFKMGFFKDLRNEWNTRRRFRQIEKCSDAVVVTLTQADAKAWSKAPHVRVIPNFTKFIVPQSSSCEVHRVIAIGRLTYQKGFDRLIDAWTIVNRRHPDWKLDIFGEGIRREALSEQIRNNGLEKSVTIHPFTKNIAQEYLNSSIFALSSNYEGFVLVLLEAMGCGLPCVAFDCPNGPAETIRNGEDGFLVENGNIKEFAEALCHFIEHEEERKSFGHRARKNIERYAPEVIMPMWEKLFNELKEK